MQSQMLNAVGETPECVPIYANYLRCPDHDIVMIYAHKLATIDRTIEITISNMRKSKYVTASENERLSWGNILKQVSEGQDVIFGSNALDMSKVGVLDLGTDPMTLPNLQVAKSKLWNEVMGLLGINNANQEKKERLVAAEVGANDEQVDATKAIALNARQQACDTINRVFGLNMSVSFGEPAPVDGEIVDDGENPKSVEQSKTKELEK